MSEHESTHFITDIIDGDLAKGKHTGVVTRFPPEPNGYLHIGHAKSICLNFGLAQKYKGRCHLRFDDTNPSKEDVEYTESIQADVKWLGFDWGEHLYYASDYYDRLYDFAVALIRKGKAYVCELSADDMRRYRGTLSEPGKASPNRERGVEENLDLFARMKAGEFPEGSRTLRAKIDMASGNINMRDPVIYRIMNAVHHRTGDRWRIYPMYDFTHCLSDSLEGITHSICTLEFEDHRPLYDWVLDELATPCHPQQIEFARLNLNYTVMSKRKLLELVTTKLVKGWDDPRMPTLSGMRRRGYPPESIRAFCDKIGVAKANSTVEISYLESCVRETLNQAAPRAMAILDPLKVVIENWPEGKIEILDAPNNPENPAAGTRPLPFSREIYIEREDFREVPPPKYFRLSPGSEVRLLHAYYLKCEKVVKDAAGNVTELRCTIDPATKGGWGSDGRKVKGTLHWLAAEHCAKAEARLYDHLFSVADPAAEEKKGSDYRSLLNPDSLKVLPDCLVEKSLLTAKVGERFQFQRQGYFSVDPDSAPGKPVFNRIVGLKDAWAKIEKKA
jgi:glutaminyl-tRNA synthetase